MFFLLSLLIWDYWFIYFSIFSIVIISNFCFFNLQNFSYGFLLKWLFYITIISNMLNFSLILVICILSFNFFFFLPKLFLLDCLFPCLLRPFKELLEGIHSWLLLRTYLHLIIPTSLIVFSSICYQMVTGIFLRVFIDHIDLLMHWNSEIKLLLRRWVLLRLH